MRKVTVSAPGKVLLVGGYLVLEAPNVGFVVAADKRFYASVETRQGGPGDGGDIEEADLDATDDSSPPPAVGGTSSSTTRIHVTSPQFHARWDYRYDHGAETLTPSPSNVSTNPFVEKTLRVCLLYLTDRRRRRLLQLGRRDGGEDDDDDDDLDCKTRPAVPPPLPPVLEVVIRADNDFYSVLPHLPGGGCVRTPAAVAALPRFLCCPLDPETGAAVVHKTGLGSSAALTTSLAGALVHCLAAGHDDFHDVVGGGDVVGSGGGGTRAPSPPGGIDSVIHNLAQICHCHAQGKVGSGFDVSAACHGTHAYRRFPKCLLPDLLDQLDRLDDGGGGGGAQPHRATASPPSPGLAETLTRLVELVPWRDDMVQRLTLPSGQLQILLADVRGGSESPGMARTVLQWKAGLVAAAAASAAVSRGADVDSATAATAAAPVEIPHWTALARLNSKVVDLMSQLSSGRGDGDGVDYDQLAALPAGAWPERSPLKELHQTLQQVRTHLREMGEQAGVPIEPAPQSALCDATMALPGVVAALVPGAGGYDAVACLYVDRPAVLDAIGKLWASWKDPSICPLAVKACDGGLRVEEVVEEGQ